MMIARLFGFRVIKQDDDHLLIIRVPRWFSDSMKQDGVRRLQADAAVMGKQYDAEIGDRLIKLTLRSAD